MISHFRIMIMIHTGRSVRYKVYMVSACVHGSLRSGDVHEPAAYAAVPSR